MSLGSSYQWVSNGSRSSDGVTWIEEYRCYLDLKEVQRTSNTMISGHSAGPSAKSFSDEKKSVGYRVMTESTLRCRVLERIKGEA